MGSNKGDGLNLNLPAREFNRFYDSKMAQIGPNTEVFGIELGYSKG